ncbi:MAG: Xaa-Pro peptidase family protein [Candidatus Omnitrophica bacterium]|nr:Xaa-Pro peptidase family protein [Candidatus Omnitrophota bacterium]MCM8829426.1 Xaa-Pro peptidase family protein [Candidatus Omnitrophota bacterium]
MDYKKRIERVRDFIEKKGIPALLIKNPSNIFYLTGLLEIEGILVIDSKDTCLFTPALYYSEIGDLITFEVEIYVYKDEEFKKFLKRYKKIGFIDNEWVFSSYTSLSKENKLIPVPDFVKKMRMIKENYEIKLIKKALEINRKVFKKIEKEIKIGMEETVIAGQIHHLIRRYGGRREAFEPIVASGIHSAYPHHKNRKKKIEIGKPLIIDAGVDYNGYKSDLTKTFFPGRNNKKFKDIYKTLQDVQQKVMEFIRPGKTGGEVHSYAVGLLKKKGLDRYFIHGLGHGVGIDVHEVPVLAPESKDEIKEGCVFTVEPGIYIPGEGGIRLEDMVII